MVICQIEGLWPIVCRSNWLLFVIISINYLFENVFVGRFAFDTNIGGIADYEEGYSRLQQDLELEKWDKDWHMEFNSQKCKVLHFDRLSQGMTCTVNCKAL